MRARRRIALGMVGVVTLVSLAWTMMSGCSLDWHVPEPAEDARTDADAAVDHSVDQAVDVSMDVDVDALDGSFDAIVGDAVVPCTQQSDCQSCVDCVLGEMTAVGTAGDCNLFRGCMLICLVGHDLLPCIEYCGAEYAAGLEVRMALDGTCLGVCNGSVPCQ